MVVTSCKESLYRSWKEKQIKCFASSLIWLSGIVSVNGARGKKYSSLKMLFCTYLSSWAFHHFSSQLAFCTIDLDLNPLGHCPAICVSQKSSAEDKNSIWRKGLCLDTFHEIDGTDTSLIHLPGCQPTKCEELDSSSGTRRRRSY